MPSPQMVSPAAPKTQGPDINGYIKAAQQKGISSDDIYSHLKQLGYVDSTGAISTTKQAPSINPGNANTDGTVTNSPAAREAQSGVRQIPSNIESTFEQGGKDVMNDLEGERASAESAGGGGTKTGGTAIPADVAAVGAGTGHVAGDIGKTAGGLLGDVLGPLLPDSVKSGIGDATKYVQDKVDAIPGMTPEIAKSLGDLFNAGTLEGGGKAIEAAPAAAEAAGNLSHDAIEGVSNSVKGATFGILDKAKDLATPEASPTMKTLIDRVKTDPVQSKNVADNFKNYIKTAQTAVKETGAPQPSDIAGNQFKTAMTTLGKKMNEAGEGMKTALKPIASAKASGVNDIMEYLKNQTADRLGSEYTPMSESSNSDLMKGMSFAQREKYLNDIIDGKTPSPFGEGEKGVFQDAPGRNMTVKDGADLKKLADLHETLNQLGDSPTVQQLHDVVQRWQEDLYKSSKPGATPMDSKIKGLMKQVGGQLNAKAKDTASAAEKLQGIEPGTYADAKAKYASLADLNENMSRRLGGNFKNAGSLIKRIFTPQNGDLNKYIKGLEKETGVPIFDHATLAKYASQLAGDTRMNSLLDKPLESAQHVEGFLKSIMNVDITKPVSSAVNVVKGSKHFLEDPEGKIMRQLGQK